MVFVHKVSFLPIVMRCENLSHSERGANVTVTVTLNERRRTGI